MVRWSPVCLLSKRTLRPQPVGPEPETIGIFSVSRTLTAAHPDRALLRISYGGRAPLAAPCTSFPPRERAGITTAAAATLAPLIKVLLEPVVIFHSPLCALAPLR